MARETAKDWVPVDRPWSQFEPISGHSGEACAGSMGEHGTPCAKPVKWKQTPTFGDSVLYACDDHKKKQEEWDRILYDSEPRPLRKLPEDHYDDVKKLLAKLDRKKRKKDEPQEEPDPTA